MSVTPAVISNQSTGMITLAITGLTNGETVILEKYLDANTNGVIDGSDLLEQQFSVTDNQASLIGGVTNVNVPGDANPALSNLTTLLNFERIDLEHIVGRYFFKLSSPTARFAPVTNTFNVTNAAYLQTFTGQVRSNGTATAVTNAVVLLFGTNVNGNNFVGGTVANNAGNYSLSAAAGTYQLAAFKNNFVGDFSASAINLGAGGTVTTNVNALPATRTVSGRVADAGNTNTPLPGLFLVLESNDGFVAITYTDANGNFNAPVTASNWKVRPQDLAVHGYVGWQNATPVDTTTGSVSGVNLLLPKGTAMIYGSIKDDLGNPLPGLSIFGQDQDTYQYESDGVSDANGNYAVAALAGNWNANLSNEDPRLTNYVVAGNLGNVLLLNGQALRQDFVLKAATNHITGFVRDNLGQPIVGVSVNAHATFNGTNFGTGNIVTDGSGNYTLNVGNGTWQVGVSCNGGNNSLNPLGFQCVNDQPVTISGNNGVANFTAQPCGALQVTTTTLPGATVGSYYNLQIQASGCTQPFSWSLSPGSAALPAGMNLDGGGNLSGTPTSSGTFNFTVRVTDNTLTTADRALSMSISAAIPPLQVTTTSLPNGATGQFYNQTISAAGGQPPYHWYLPGGTGSLPPGTMNLSTNGILSGTPAAAGTYNFWVGVWDNNSPLVVSQFLSLTIIAVAPLQVATPTLPVGTVGTYYSNQVGATGGQPPYNWSLSPGSNPLPAGLALTGGGIISGTPTTAGSFPFSVRVTDANTSFADQAISLVISNGSGGGLQWTYKPFMANAHVGGAAAAVNGLIYVLGGFNTGAEGTEVYNPSFGTWQSLAPMPTPRGRLAVGVINGKIYTAGGVGGQTALEIYDPILNTWSNRHPMNVARLGCAGGVINNLFYVVGGTTDSSSTLEVYNPATDSWTLLSPMPTPRWLLAAGVISNQLYAVGGVNAITGGAALSTVEVYDPATDSWAPRPSMPTGREEFAATVISNQLYAVGGFGTPQLEIYDPVANAWATAPSLLMSRGNLAAAGAGARCFALGGETGPGGTALPFVEQYASAVGEKLVTTMLTSGAGVTAAGLGAGAPSVAIRNRLDAGDTTGLVFSAVSNGAAGSSVGLPIGALPGTQIINIPPATGQNGFFQQTFVLPPGYTGIQLSLGANVDFYGRAFVNGNAVTPSVTQNGRITSSGNSYFAINNAALFHAGVNELLLADANSDGGASGAAFFALVTYRPLPVLTQVVHPLSNQFQFSLTNILNETYTIQYSTNLLSWTTLLATNSAAASITILDPNATNAFRFYRTLAAP